LKPDQMSSVTTSYRNDRMKIPILLSTGRDARLAANVVAGLRQDAVICGNLDQLLSHIHPGGGPFILGDEALVDDKPVADLTAVIKDQPEWSDIPGIILTGRNNQQNVSQCLKIRREMVFIRRPVRKSIFTNIVRTAVEVRRRQFQMRDLIENLVQTNETLRTRTTQLQNLALEMTRVEDRERRRIARMLHDDLQQMLASARLQTEMLFDDLPDPAKERGRTVYDILSQAMKAARNLSHELSPVVTRRDRLDQSLKELADRMAGRYGLNIQTTLAPVDEDIPDDIKRFVYRSVQELLFNCTKHARAGHAALTVTTESRKLSITITDDGQGFDPDRLKIFGGSERGFGLFNIHERVSILNGTLKVYSRHGEGSRFVLTVPF